MAEKQQWAQWKQEQTKMQLEAFKQDVQSPVRNQVRSGDILSLQQLGSNKNTEDMVKNGVMSKFAKRKLKKEQEVSGIVSDMGSHGGGNASFGRAASYDCYNEAGWLKVAVRKLEDENKQLAEDKKNLVQEKSLWYVKFQEENKKWMGMVADIKIAKAKLSTEISDFVAQRNALRSVEICANDRKIYDACMNKMPIPNGLEEITSGNKRLRATELHALLTGSVVSARTAQAEFTEHFTAMVMDAERMFMDSVSAGANLQAQQKQVVLIEQVKQWSKNCTDLTAAMIKHSHASDLSCETGTVAAGNVDDVVGNVIRQTAEIDELKLNNNDLRQTIAQLRSKNAELTRALKDRAYKKPSSKRSPRGPRSPESTKNAQSPAAESEAESEYETDPGEVLDHDDLIADVPVRHGRDAAEEYGSNYTHIEELLSLVSADAATGEGEPDEEREHRLQRVNTKEFRLILEDELREMAAGEQESSEFSSLFPVLSNNGDAVEKKRNAGAQSTGRQLFIESITDPSNRLYHDALHLYLQDIILEHPLLRQHMQGNAHSQLGEKIIYVLYEEISEIVAQQICDVVVATLSDKDVTLQESEMRNELLAIQYLRNNLLPNQQLLNNFITLALHSVTVHPEINALVTMAVSFFFEKEVSGAQ